jgi:hypothetical protein
MVELAAGKENGKYGHHFTLREKRHAKRILPALQALFGPDEEGLKEKENVSVNYLSAALSEESNLHR